MRRIAARKHVSERVSFSEAANWGSYRKFSHARCRDPIFREAQELGYGRYFLERPLPVEDDHGRFLQAGMLWPSFPVSMPPPGSVAPYVFTSPESYRCVLSLSYGVATNRSTS